MGPEDDEDPFIDRIFPDWLDPFIDRIFPDWLEVVLIGAFFLALLAMLLFWVVLP